MAFFIPTYPKIMNGNPINSNETIYPCPVPDFGLSKIGLMEGTSYTINTQSLEMLLVLEGEISIEGIIYKAGEVAMAGASQELVIQAKASSVLFRSFVP